MNFNLTILGCSSATPTKARHQSSQLLNIDNKYFLIDCGEGTQQQLRKYNFHIQKINNIFISHLHGDHYQGLIGLISTLHLLGRNEDLHIYGFKTPLKEIIDIQLKYSNTKLNYNIIYHDINPNKTECIYKDNIITVDNIVLQHSVPCCGFLFRENPKPRNIKKDFLRIEKIPFEVFDEIKAGKDYINPDGKIYKNKDITTEPPKSRSFAYCSDTIYDEKIIPQILDIDVLYHEATFMNDLKDIAKEKFHSTTIDAATIALKANVKQLIIGHYSARYKVLEPLLIEAQSLFPNTSLAEDGKLFII